MAITPADIMEAVEALDAKLDQVLELLSPNITPDETVADDLPPEPADEGDPWGAPEPTRQPAKRSSSRGSGSRNQRPSRPTGRGGASRGGPSRGSSSGGTKVPTDGVFEDDKGKEWEFGLSDAPDCEHGEPCAYVTKPGAQWKAWACPHGFKDWRNKCDVFDFING